MNPHCTRREFLQGAGALAGASLLGPLASAPLQAASNKPSSPVSIARCKDYDLKAVLKQLYALADQLGGLGKLVAGKTVAVKVNLTGNPRQQALDLPAGRTYQVHPATVLATAEPSECSPPNPVLAHESRSRSDGWSPARRLCARCDVMKQRVAAVA